MLVPLAVVAVSVASLLTALHSERSMGALVEQNSRLVQAQSTPLLMLDSGNRADNDQPVISLTLSNVGTGPARILWFHLVDPSGVDYSGQAVTRRAEQVGAIEVSSQRIALTLMRSGADRDVLSWPKPVGNLPALSQWQALDDIRFRLHASACYCSMFDACWITNFGSALPEPVSSCGAEPGRTTRPG